MNGQQTLIARGTVSILAGIASVLACSTSYLFSVPSRLFDRLLSLAFCVSRIGIFALIFIVLHIAPRGDIPAYYWPEANSVLKGLLPYRDFTSSYSPLHPYLDAVAISIWHSPLAIILLAILAECVLLPLWLRFARAFLSEAETRTSAILYLTSAISIQFVAIDGQNNVIIALLLGLSLFFLVRHKPLLSGLSTGLSIAAVKFLPLLFVPAYFLSLRRRWSWLAGLTLVLLLVYGTCAVLHLPMLTPLQGQGDLKTAGNLPYLVESILGISLSNRLWDLIFLVVLAAIFLVVARAVRSATPEGRLRIITFSMAALTLALLTFSKKSWPPYMMLALFPICALVDRRRISLIGFALVGFVASVSPSYWATVLLQPSSLKEHQGLLAGHAPNFILLGLQIALIAGYGWLFRLSLQSIASASQFSSPAP